MLAAGAEAAAEADDRGIVEHCSLVVLRTGRNVVGPLAGSSATETAVKKLPHFGQAMLAPILVSGSFIRVGQNGHWAQKDIPHLNSLVSWNYLTVAGIS